MLGGREVFAESRRVEGGGGVGERRRSLGGASRESLSSEVSLYAVAALRMELLLLCPGKKRRLQIGLKQELFHDAAIHDIAMALYRHIATIHCLKSQSIAAHASDALALRRGIRQAPRGRNVCQQTPVTPPSASHPSQ